MRFKQIPLTSYEQKLHDSAVETAQIYHDCEARLLVIIEEVDRLRLYGKFGLASTVLYAKKILNLTRSVSYSFQAVARKSREVPELMTAVQAGLSISTAHKIVAQLSPANQAKWIEKAKTLPQHDLERELAMANPKRGRRATKKEPIDRTHSRMAIDISNNTLAKLLRAQELLGGSEADVLDAALEILLEKKDPVRKADRAIKRAAEQTVQTEKTEQNYSQTETVYTSAKFGMRVPFNAKTYHAVNGRDRGQCQAILPDGTKCCSSRWVEIHHIL